MKSNNVDKQKRAKELFENTAVHKAIFIVAIPGLLTYIMLGLFSFLNQVFILNFVPETIKILNEGNINTGIIYSYLNKEIPILNYDQFNQLYSYYFKNLSSGENINMITTDVVAALSVNALNPFVIFCNSIVLLIPIGASVYYTKCISKKVEYTGKDLWSTTFYATIIFCLFASFVSFISIWSGLVDKIASEPNFNQTALQALDNNKDLAKELNINGQKLSYVFTSYYHGTHEIVIHWVKVYVYIYASGTVLQGLYLLFSYFIRAEGKNAYVMIWAVIANLVGIGLNILFIKVLALGVLGGVVATIIAWCINLFAYVLYIIVANKKNTTWLSIHHLIHFKFRLKFLLPITLLGLSAFIRNIGVAIAFVFITLLLNKLPYSDGSTNIYYWSKAAPVISLFFLAIFGISDGSRSLLSYSYTQRNFERVKQIYKWSLLISFAYAFLAYILMLIFGKYFAMALHVDISNAQEYNGVITYLRIMMLRLVFFSFAIGGMLLSQGTNNIKNSIIISSTEGFITFWFVMAAAVGFGFLLNNKFDVNHFYSTLVIPIGYAINALVAGLIIFGISVYWLNKIMPKIDTMKLSWSRKVEHQFFDDALKYEEHFKKIEKRFD